MQHRPLYIVPLMVEQPTWGGSYIARSKHLAHSLVEGKNIGQAFELYNESWVSASATPNFAFATATNLSEPLFADTTNVEQLQNIVEQDIAGTLGAEAVRRGWTNMQVLIKFTQAQNNSYQVHVVPGKEFGKWLPKPESWYFLEKGKATLGLADTTAVDAYKARCIEIDTRAQEISAQIQAGQLTVEEGRAELQVFIDQDHPRKFVNTVHVDSEAVIDLSQGGIHHSWEMDEALPDGNIVYEVQVNVMDEYCTLRSFDQGNIKGDGKVRPLTIEDYFTALDVDKERNTPAHYFSQTSTEEDQGTTIRVLFQNQFYVSELISFERSYQGKYSITSSSFHHVYALEGDVSIMASDQMYPLKQGWSLFIPAAIGQYELVSEGGHARVITTHL